MREILLLMYRLKIPRPHPPHLMILSCWEGMFENSHTGGDVVSK